MEGHLEGGVDVGFGRRGHRHDAAILRWRVLAVIGKRPYSLSRIPALMARSRA